MKLKLKNQTILITGSGSGIGRGIADGFLKEGASVKLSWKASDSRAVDLR